MSFCAGDLSGSQNGTIGLALSMELCALGLNFLATIDIVYRFKEDSLDFYVENLSAMDDWLSIFFTRSLSIGVYFLQLFSFLF